MIENEQRIGDYGITEVHRIDYGIEIINRIGNKGIESTHRIGDYEIEGIHKIKDYGIEVVHRIGD